MKKITTLLFVLFIGVVHAQTSNLYRKSGVGIKGGYNLASAVIDGDDDVDNRDGFSVGFYNELYMSHNTSIQTELLYSQQGYTIKNNSGTFEQKIDYINLPVLFKGYLTDFLYIEVGPQIGIAINHEEKVSDNFNLFEGNSEQEPRDFDWGANVGAGFKTKSGINLGARYYFGLSEVYREEEQKNRVLHFFVGFDF
ncbi:porin family protein [Wenyingzhuangia sp. IMCC45533]